MVDHPNTPPTEPTGPPQPLDGRDADDPLDTYYRVTDTVGGLNFRLSDNLMQAGAAALGGIIGAVIGLITIGGPLAGLLVGGVLGVIAAVFLTGFGLMIYRGINATKKRR